VKFTVKMNAQVSRRLHDAAADALEDITEDVLAEARQVVPIEEATLSRSGFAEVDRKALVGQVAFDTPYAVRQHEDPTLRHDAGRKHHYLSDTAEENKRRHLDYLRSKLRDA
jgi:hypothetical protein